MTTAIEREDKLQKKFEKVLPEDWRVRVEALDTEALKAKLIEITTNENENTKARQADEDLATKKETYAEALAPYKEASSVNKLKIMFIIRELERNGAV